MREEVNQNMERETDLYQISSCSKSKNIILWICFVSGLNAGQNARFDLKQTSEVLVFKYIILFSSEEQLQVWSQHVMRERSPLSNRTSPILPSTGTQWLEIWKRMLHFCNYSI